MKRWLGAWLLLMALAGVAVAGLFDGFGSANQEPRLLPAQQAFQLNVNAPDPLTLQARWTIAPGYYLYRDKLRLEVLNSPGVTIEHVQIPPGEITQDPYFGEQQIFRDTALLTVRLQRSGADSGSVELEAHYQGCAEIGVCYPPLSQNVAVALPALASAAPQPAHVANAPQQAHVPNQPNALPAPTVPNLAPSNFTAEAEQDRLARLLSEQRWLAIPAFFGFGLLLTFTPCVFPMLPILSGLIAGQGATLTRRRAVWLTVVYVVAMAFAYAVIGVVAALLGSNVQAWLQNPWVLTSFAALFVALALSMFGFYDLQLPAALQQRLSVWSNQQRGGEYVGVAIMGVLSALIVGPCIAPPLLGALTFIAVTGDVFLGGLTLFVMGLGMGVPLLMVGISAGHWLPRAGHWMERIKAVFGVLLLAVALWLLERVLPVALSMVLWALLLIVSATYMGALQSVAHGAPAWRLLVKGLGVALLVYGVLLLVGVAAGGRDAWQPLRGVSLAVAPTQASAVPLFRPVKTLAEVQHAVNNAAGQLVMLDFYADWCVSCKELERFTFSAPAVRSALQKVVALQADVSAYDKQDQELLKHFGIIGPPAILFFNAQGQEQKAQRLVGFIDEQQFLKHLQALR